MARVISVEKEIQACLEAERARSREWLEGVKKDAEERFAREEEQAGEAFRKFVEKSRDEAAAMAGRIIENAEEEAEQLLALSDETLRGIIMRRLRTILPG